VTITPPSEVKASPARRRLAIPIAAQIVALLIAGVVVGQVATLVIVMLVPPPRPAVYRLSDIAVALMGRDVKPKDGRELVRSMGDPPPLPPANSRRARYENATRANLAAILGVSVDRIRVASQRRRSVLWEAPLLGSPSRPPEPRGDGPRPFGDGAGSPGGSSDGSGGLRGPGGAGGLGRPFEFGGDRNELIFEDFKAALQQPTGQWVVVNPLPDPFPLVWQARIGAWFLLCLIVFGPAGYLFARRLVSPISAFAKAADRLGRDPRAALVELEGPAEIGVAARAFNDMQARLKRYVEDRTSMIGAISHDLRTPLTRIRFKIEAAAPEIRAAISPDIDQMEAMITAALAFVRDATQPYERETLDLLSVLECVVDDARSGGGEATLVDSPPLAIEGDPLALQRLFANLIENAIKYGGVARVRLFAQGGDAVVEVADEGPGLPQRELEHVFEPFYRAEKSRNRDTGGIGLGLAVARSVARAHGGDVILRSTTYGLIALVQLPLAPESPTPSAFDALQRQDAAKSAGLSQTEPPPAAA
jgi:two-component system OmpR family sensor kinase